MTGKSPAKLGMYNYRPPNHPMHLRDSAVIIAEVLINPPYIKAMSLVDYELYDLSKDTGQTNNIFDSHPKATAYERMIDNKLQEVQKEGHYWKQLPEAEGLKKVKTEWVKY